MNNLASLGLYAFAYYWVSRLVGGFLALLFILPAINQPDAVQQRAVILSIFFEVIPLFAMSFFTSFFLAGVRLTKSYNIYIMTGPVAAYLLYLFFRYSDFWYVAPVVFVISQALVYAGYRVRAMKVGRI